MAEVQIHGFIFEDWFRRAFFNASADGSFYRKLWDVDADAAALKFVPKEFRGLPISVKVAKVGGAICLGDALRQRQINGDFLMVVGFHEQRTETEKWIVDIAYARFTAKDWAALWGEVTPEHICDIDRAVKNRATHYSSMRFEAQRLKELLPTGTSEISLNPKIDANQRRVQCSLPNSAFWRAVGRERQGRASLWSQDFPNPIISSARTFNNRPLDGLLERSAKVLAAARAELEVVADWKNSVGRQVAQAISFDAGCPGAVRLRGLNTMGISRVRTLPFRAGQRKNRRTVAVATRRGRRAEDAVLIS